RLAGACGGGDRQGKTWPNDVKIWDSVTGQEVVTFQGHAFQVTSLAFSPDGQRLASGSADRTVKVWDLAAGKEVFTLSGHTSGVLTVAYSPDGERLASGGHDQTVKLWDVTTGRETLTLKGQTNAVATVAFSPDGKRLAAARYYNLKVWNWGAVSGEVQLQRDA